MDFNTSHVNVNPKAVGLPSVASVFQYISC